MFDLNAIGADILSVLERHKLQPEIFGLNVTLPSTAFDALFSDYPHLVDGRTVIVNITVNTVQASLQIRKRYTFPPE